MQIKREGIFYYKCFNNFKEDARSKLLPVFQNKFRHIRKIV